MTCQFLKPVTKEAKEALNKLDTSLEMGCIYQAHSLLINRRFPLYCRGCKEFWKCLWIGIKKKLFHQCPICKKHSRVNS